MNRFPVLDNVIYLNHAAVAPWPREACEAVIAFAEENLALGATHYPRWLQTESELRQRLTRLINAPSIDDVALVKNTSEALSFVAHGLDWQSGDNVVLFAQEFPSNRIVWQSLARYGVEIRLLDLYACDDVEAALMAACDERTRLLAISAVQYARGYRADLARLGRFCQEQHILFCVDAIQWLGALTFDSQAVQADFVMADGHKWLLGAEGLGLFYCRAKLREQLNLHEYGWHMTENKEDFDGLTWQPARSARRFECGSPNLLCTHALNASMGVLLDTGMATVERNVLNNTSLMIDFIENNDNLELLSLADEHSRSGIISFRHRRLSTDELHRHLREQGVVCAPRGGGIRFSPHYYTPADQIRQALDIAATATV
jgi:selenocysteine lyase/cysteine desulfurase